MEVVGADNRPNNMGNNVIFGVDSRGRGYFQVLMPDPTRSGAFRRLPAGYDNLVPHAAMINDLRNAGQMGVMVALLPGNPHARLRPHHYPLSITSL